MDIKSKKNKKPKTNNIFLTVSQLYVVVGLDRFGRLCPLLIKLWERLNQRDYFRHVYEIQDICSIEHLTETPYQTIKRLSQQNKIDIMPQVRQCLNSKDSVKMTEIRDNMLCQIKAANLDKKETDILKKNVHNLTNTSFGSRHESHAIKYYCEKQQTNVVCKQQYVKKHIATVGKTQWFLTGKVDGITEDGILVEVKNRIHKLFNKLLDYEKPQIQAYLKMMNIQKGHLVEFIKNPTNPQMNIIEVEKEPKYWKEFIIPGIEKFIQFFYHFIKRSELKYIVLMNDEEKIGDFFNKFVYSSS